MSKGTNIQTRKKGRKLTLDDWFQARMSGPETSMLKRFIENWEKTELRKPKPGTAFSILLKLSISHLAKNFDQRWNHMDQAKLNEFGLRAKHIRSYIQRKVKAMEAPEEDPDATPTVSDCDNQTVTDGSN